MNPFIQVYIIYVFIYPLRNTVSLLFFVQFCVWLCHCCGRWEIDYFIYTRYWGKHKKDLYVLKLHQLCFFNMLFLEKKCRLLQQHFPPPIFVFFISSQVYNNNHLHKYECQFTRCWYFVLIIPNFHYRWSQNGNNFVKHHNEQSRISPFPQNSSLSV